MRDRVAVRVQRRSDGAWTTVYRATPPPGVAPSLLPPAAATTQSRSPIEDSSTAPLRLSWARRRGSSLDAGDFGSTFGQQLEPAGRYVIEDSGQYLDDTLHERGVSNFTAVLRIEFGGSYEEESNWKQRLATHYGVTGLELSHALVADGYDCIYTYDSYGSSEIVDLTVVVDYRS